MVCRHVRTRPRTLRLIGLISVVRRSGHAGRESVQENPREGCDCRVLLPLSTGRHLWSPVERAPAGADTWEARPCPHPARPSPTLGRQPKACFPPAGGACWSDQQSLTSLPSERRCHSFSRFSSVHRNPASPCTK